MSERRHPRVVNVDEVEGKLQEKGRRFGATRRALGGATGASGLGCTHYEIAPGRTAFPFHYHCINHEAIYVLEGEGTLFIGGEEAELRAGSCVHLPARLVHCLANTGASDLRLLGVFRPAGSPAEAYYPDGTPAVPPEETT